MAQTPGIAKGIRAIAGRPYVTLGAVVGAVVVALWMALGLGIQGSRHALVSPDHPYQSRLLSLVEDFGLPGDLIYWVEGGSPEERRRAVLELSKAVRAQEALAQVQITGPPRLEAWAPIFAAQNAKNLEAVLSDLGEPEEVKAALGQGLLGIIDRSYEKMSEPDPERPPSPDELARTGDLIRALASLMKGASLNELSAGLIGQSRASQKKAGAKPKPERTVVPLDDAGFLRSDDGTALLVVVSNALDNDEQTAMQRVVDAARDAQAKVVQGYPDLSIALSGYPVLQVDEQKAIARGLLESSAATGLGILLVLALAFSSFRKSLIALIPLGVGAALSLGALWLLFGQVNAITSSFLAVLLGLGIDISVHLLARVDEGLQEGGPSRVEVLSSAFAAAGPAVFVGTITTAMAFLLLFGAEFAAYGELGIITAVGLILMLMAAFVALPALLVVWPGRARGSKARAQGQALLSRLCRALLGRSALVVGLGVVLALGSAYAGSGLSFNPRYFDFMPTSLQSVALLERLEQEEVASPLAVSVRADSLQDAHNKAKRLRSSELVASVQSPSDLLDPLHTDFDRLKELRRWWPQASSATPGDADALRKGVGERAQAFVDLIDEQLFSLSMQRSKQQLAYKKMLEGWKASWQEVGRLAKQEPKSGEALVAAQAQVLAIREGIAKLLYAPSVEQARWTGQDLPTQLGRRFVAKDPKAGLRLLVTPAGDFWAPGRAQAFLDVVESVDPRSAGHSMSVIVHSAMIKRDFFRASGWALLAIALVLTLTFRRLRCVLLVLLPLAVGWCWMLGVYALLGLSLNAANIVVLPLVLGIGVDAGVHLMHRVNEEPAGDEGIIHAVSATGSAITICALTTMVGFAGLMVAQYGGMKSLGLSMVIGILTTWLSTIVIMPALLHLFPERRAKSGNA